ncbi:hypothetical protein E5288_WYG013188 [Bos mutus]|uniref:Uncharacterized protein n=1 Tax=Bos mutus TaxID=72004 RepID=A0A6B0S091_9CETA|nr:hypothetical protein [Bos mutus]
MSELGNEPIVQDDKSCHGDEYQEDENTLGFINPGTDKHKLCTDLMTEILSQSDVNGIEEIVLQYPN